MTQEQIDKYLYEECEIFDETKTLAEYKAMICKYLMLCPWNYSEEGAKKVIQQYGKIIGEAYSGKETVGDIALDIGFCCG